MTQAVAQSASTTASSFDIEAVRREFPALGQSVHGKRLVYLDSAASALRCSAAIGAVDEFLREYPANVHRGVHALSERATTAYEKARVTTARFLGASSPREVVFVRGTTEAINLVAHSFLRPRLGRGDEILVTGLEHHANIVPWQLVAQERGARLVAAPLDDRGDVIVEEFARLLTARTRMAAVSHTSNSLGTVTPLAELIRLARERGVPVLVDGAQAVPHGPVDVGALGCDFFALSGHKAYGPNGIGALWGRLALLQAMPPYQGGGSMIHTVTFEKTTFAEPPERFEAGTPNVEGAIGLGAALEWLESLDSAGLEEHEAQVLRHASDSLRRIDGVRLIGEPRRRAGVVSFVVEGVHPHDVGTILDTEGVAVRAGHHCAQPVMEHFGVPATVRASFAPYSTGQEVDALVAALAKVREIFGR